MEHFNVGAQVVYPSHGVGIIEDIEKKELLGKEMVFYVIKFQDYKMTLKIPVSRAKADGLRTISKKDKIEQVYTTIKSDASAKASMHKMWTRRAQEYESKINSGDVLAVAEVVRDLFKDKAKRSYSENNIYFSAMNKLAKELSILENKEIEQIIENISDILESKEGSA